MSPSASRSLDHPGREGFAGELLQCSVASELRVERGPALGAADHLGPVEAGLAHDVTLSTLPDLTEKNVRYSWVIYTHASGR